MSATFNPTYLKVSNEGADLKVWYQGKGPLLILIQGGGGDGARFNDAIPSLRERYTVVAYDRRGNAGSTVDAGWPLNPVQSARDVVSIIKALGHDRASLFGTSSGGLIALQLAASYPQYLHHAIIHETPTLSLLVGEKTDRIDEGFDVYETFKRQGAEAALVRFRASVQGRLHEAEDKAPSHRYRSSGAESDGGEKGGPEQPQPRPPHRLDYFFEHEFLILNSYTPPFAQIRANEASVAVVEGRESGDVFYARVTRTQAEVLGCPHHVWPGGHDVFQRHPEAFGESLTESLATLDDRTGKWEWMKNGE